MLADGKNITFNATISSLFRQTKHLSPKEFILYKKSSFGFNIGCPNAEVQHSRKPIDVSSKYLTLTIWTQPKQ
jgi:hypothetical protein